MAIQPVITAVGTPVRGATMQVTGTGFGRVSSVCLVDPMLHQYECDYMVDRGDSIHLTVPFGIPDNVYYVLLGTLDNITSINMAGTIDIPSVPITPPLPPPAPNPVPGFDPFAGGGGAMDFILQRLRLEISDYEESFQASIQGDGQSRRFDLPDEVIEPTGLIVSIEGGSVELPDDDAGYGQGYAGGYSGLPGSAGYGQGYEGGYSGLPVPINGATSLTANVDYILEPRDGIITTIVPVPDDEFLVVTGKHFQFFTDAELTMFIYTSALEHTHNQETAAIYRDIDNFKHYVYAAQTVDTLPPVEYLLVAQLAAIQVLEVMMTDAAFDIDVTTAEGTSLPREERYKNLAQLIEAKQDSYDKKAAMLGVGLSRIEVFTLRRKSRTTGRLVPVYVDREYDDVITPPIRVVTPRNTDISGSGYTYPDPFAYGGTGIGGYP